MERKIGEIFKYKGITYKTVPRKKIVKNAFLLIMTVLKMIYILQEEIALNL